MLLLLATARTHDHHIRLKKSSRTAQGVVAVKNTPYTRLMGILELFLVMSCNVGLKKLSEKVVDRRTQLLDQAWHFPNKLSTGNGATGARWRKKRETRQHHQANC